MTPTNTPDPAANAAANGASNGAASRPAPAADGSTGAPGAPAPKSLEGLGVGVGNGVWYGGVGGGRRNI